MMTHRTTVKVDTETGQYAVIEFTHDAITDVYRVRIAGSCIDEAPEALTASLQMAILELARWRRAAERGTHP